MGKRGDDLRALMREYPPPDDVHRMLQGLRTESDRGAALVGSSLIDATLERVIKQALKDKSPELGNQLFQNEGPLSGFYSKILVGRAFGIFNDVLANELHILRAIRNVFAHSTGSITFHTPAVAAELNRSEVMNTLRKNMTKEHAVEVTYDGKDDFSMFVGIMFLSLDSHHQFLGGLPLQERSISDS